MAGRNVKKVGRRRRMTGWMLLTLGALVAGVWVASCFWIAYWTNPPHTLMLRNGVVSASSMRTMVTFTPPPPQDLGWYVAWQDPADRELFMVAPSPPAPLPGEFQTLFIVAHSKETGLIAGNAYCVVLWPLPLLLSTPAALLLRSGIVARRRAFGNKCKSCGYDLMGLGVDAKCPECGKDAVVMAAAR